MMAFVNAIEILLVKLSLNMKRLQYGDENMLRQVIILMEVMLSNVISKKCFFLLESIVVEPIIL